MQLSIQEILSFGKHNFTTYPLDRNINNAHICWNATAICCKMFGNSYATAQVLASITYFPIVEDDNIYQILGYNPYTNLAEHEKTIVRYCVLQAKLHEFEYELQRGNYYVANAVQLCKTNLQIIEDELNRQLDKIIQTNKKASSTKNLTPKKVIAKTKKTVH